MSNWFENPQPQRTQISTVNKRSFHSKFESNGVQCWLQPRVFQAYSFNISSIQALLVVCHHKAVIRVTSVLILWFRLSNFSNFSRVLKYFPSRVSEWLGCHDLAILHILILIIKIFFWIAWNFSVFSVRFDSLNSDWRLLNYLKTVTVRTETKVSLSLRGIVSKETVVLRRWG